MYGHVYHNLRARFPANKGWEIYSQDNWSHGSIPDFVVDRNYRGCLERVIVEVKAGDHVALSDIRQINRYATKLAGGNCIIVGKILAIPSGTSVLNVPDDIEIMRLRTFVWK